MPTQPDIVRLKITLGAVKPTVMRRIEVPVDVKLDGLHEIIQAVTPWDNYHAYEFRVRDRHWGIPAPDIHDYYGAIAGKLLPQLRRETPLDLDRVAPVVGDARKTTLGRVLNEPSFKALLYTYDFGGPRPCASRPPAGLARSPRSEQHRPDCNGDSTPAFRAPADERPGRGRRRA
jgi:hypothetical protein